MGAGSQCRQSWEDAATKRMKNRENFSMILYLMKNETNESQKERK